MKTFSLELPSLALPKSLSISSTAQLGTGGGFKVSLESSVFYHSMKLKQSRSVIWTVPSKMLSCHCSESWGVFWTWEAILSQGAKDSLLPSWDAPYQKEKVVELLWIAFHSDIGGGWVKTNSDWLFAYKTLYSAKRIPATWMLGTTRAHSIYSCL